MHYENLPVYKKAIELSVLMENIVKHFSRFHRYELGAEMRKLAREIAAAVVKANFATNKIAAITHLRDKSEEMKLTIMIAEHGYLSNGLKQRVMTEKFFCLPNQKPNMLSLRAEARQSAGFFEAQRCCSRRQIAASPCSSR